MKTFNISFRRSLLWLVALTALPIKAMAAPAQLSIEPFTIQAGESKEMTIDLTNPDDEITLVQFDLRLPEGLNISQTGGELDIDIAGRTTWRKHTLEVNERSNGLYSFLLASSSSAILSSTEGPIVKVMLTAANSFSGGIVRLENILLVTPDEKGIKPADVEIVLGSNQPDPQPIELVEGKAYYMKNVATGKYFSCGGSWGTHAMVDDFGLDIVLQKTVDGKSWKIMTGFRTDNSTTPVGALGEEGYVDNKIDTEHTIRAVDKDIYVIEAVTGKYLTVLNGWANFDGTSTNDARAQWMFVPAEDLRAERVASLYTATESHPVDATFLIGAPNFNRYDLRFNDAWTTDFGAASAYTGVGHPNTEDTESILEIYRSSTYQAYGSFSICQKIHLLPGHYKLAMQGFYRDGDIYESAQIRANGLEKLDALLFVDDKEIPLKSIYAEAKSTEKRGWETQTAMGYVPSTMQGAGYTFQSGAYWNELGFDVEAESDVEIGVRGRESVNYNNWTTIDNFRLTYYGAVPPEPEVTASLSIEPSIEPFPIQPGESKELTIDLTNPDDEITLVQFDLQLPEGLSVKQTGGEYDIDIAGRTTWRKHSLDANEVGNRRYRFLLSSSSNTVLSGTEGAIIKVTLTAANSFTEGTAKFEDILLVTPDEKELKPKNFSIQISNGVGINATKVDGKPVSVYDYTGRRLATPQRGVNLLRMSDGTVRKVVNSVR